MVKVTDRNFYMNEYLKKNLDILKKKIRQDWYFIIIISGSNRVRIGKSTLAQQISYYLDPKYSFDNLTFESSRLKGISLKLPKYRVVHYDEAMAGLDAKRAMETMQKDLLDFLAQAGQLNQFLVLVLPDFFVLNKEIATNQSICLINCYTHTRDIFKRGYFAFYNIYAKNKLYYWGRKKGGDYWTTKPDFTGDFTNHQVLNKPEYRTRKRKALEQLKKADIYYKYKRLMDRYLHTMNQRNNLIGHIHKEGWMGTNAIANFVGVKNSSITPIVTNKINQKQKDEIEGKEFEVEA
ncbi:MAG TPA: hypothetical protein ENI23_15455 [bacterium]|nr:hypothetical protein [bacterium]